MEEEEIPQDYEKESALHLKSLAEQKYNSSCLKSALKYAKRALRLCPDMDGVSEMVTAFTILRVSAKSSTSPDWYKILQVEPFSPIQTIKKQYKTLALTLHPDKTPFRASEEAFKLVGEAFRALSDKVRRKEYDTKLRVALQNAVDIEASASDGTGVLTFWTMCSTCQLLHKFERRYLGHNLMCPSCKKSFKATEVPDITSDGKDDDDDDDDVDDNEDDDLADDEDRIQTRFSSRVKNSEPRRHLGSKRKNKAANVERPSPKRPQTEKSQSLKPCNSSKRVQRSVKGKSLSEDTMTIAEMQMIAKKKQQEEKTKIKGKGKEIDTNKNEQTRCNGEENTGVMPVDDSDFYDFDKDRVEKSFKVGQVWALYDDDDGMPRHYGLLEEIVSIYPFEVKMSWLDLQNNGDEGLINWEKLGFHISCGRFTVSKKTSVNSLNCFSHLVDYDRAARELYRVYPKKGSVWALYNGNALDSEGQNLLVKDKRCYDIVVFLTSYSELHGLSLGYLEKVDGFKTVFKRKEIGVHAVRWLEKDDARLFSHQIPSRKLSGEELSSCSGLPKDCWELDPASLPPELLTIGWMR